MTNARKAQKNVPASTIVAGDIIFRTSPEHGDLAMHVSSVSEGQASDGRAIFIWRGDVYRLGGAGSGPSPSFLGDISATRTGNGE